ncbi:MAG: hypothetical protein PGMFKBFP_02394 [Anaerolineales bacterium]|nr:hypothetical protein [Anaerolineales bacterium]
MRLDAPSIRLTRPDLRARNVTANSPAAPSTEVVTASANTPKLSMLMPAPGVTFTTSTPSRFIVNW